MKHYGDITKINGADLPAVDVITGGSPCQDLSVAGKRAGLQGERSGLFLHQIRIIKEMRSKYVRAEGADQLVRLPRYCIWENVPGAFSSNGGKDFQAVLTEFARIEDPNAPDVPMPKKGRWPKSGCIYDEMGQWSIAWRLHDAQFWGVPQRRKRIALVADFGGLSAPEILFEREGVRGISKEGETPFSKHTNNAEIGDRNTIVYGFDCNANWFVGVVINDTSLTVKAVYPPSVCEIHLNGTGKSAVRYLTPLETERIQGFPDGWTDIGDWTDSNGKLHKAADSPRYKALGNSIAVGYANRQSGFWCWMARRICAQYERQITMASLFDGIGGFPLAFQAAGAIPVWASEIEEFCIAVTKKHFPDEDECHGHGRSEAEVYPNT